MTKQAVAPEASHPFTMVDNDICKKQRGDLRKLDDTKLAAKIATFDKDLGKIVEEAGEGFDISNVKSISGTDDDKFAKIIELHSCLAAAQDVNSERDQQKVMLETIANGGKPSDLYAHKKISSQGLLGDAPLPGNPIQMPGTPQNLGDIVAEVMREQGVDPDKGWDGGKNMDFMLNLKSNSQIQNALFHTGAGWEPESVREAGYVQSIRRPPQVSHLYRTVMTTQEKIKYMRQTTRNNVVARVAENDPLPDATILFAEASVDVIKAGVYIHVTEEQLADVHEVQDMLTYELPMMVREKIDEKLILGVGGAADIQGVRGLANAQEMLLTYDTSDGLADPTLGYKKAFNAMRRAKTKVRVGGRAVPNAYIMNSAFWDNISLQETTAAGFFMGSPFNDFDTRPLGTSNRVN